MKTLLERLEQDVNNSYSNMLEMLEDESLEDVTEFIEEATEKKLYSTLNYIKRLLVNDEGRESVLIDKIIRINIARDTVMGDKDTVLALKLLKR